MSTRACSAEAIHLLEVSIQPVSITGLHAVIARAVSEARRCIIAHHNCHSIYLFHHDSRMRSLYTAAEAVHFDSMPLLLLARIMGRRVCPEHRVTYVDWVRPLMREAARQEWRVFYLGSRPGVAERAAEMLRCEHPGLVIETHDGYFDATPGSDENREVVARIAAFVPNVLMVGMGMPRQEHWILDNLAELRANAVLTAGACMDYVAGAVPTPPRWLGRVGLEWAYRLLCEPRRLWARYLVEPWFLLRLLVSELLTGRSRGSRTQVSPGRRRGGSCGHPR